MRRQNQSLIEQSDDDCTSSASQILERVQPDRVTLTKPEEDRRRRTIIVEKKNGSYGFTLQSYGIHYKKEQEIEMITYVDYVDYDGSAYRAGMREGDVILSINGTDMEKADHKTLVNFIKSCDSRMRMVVLFEDCVRKVELHIRYIQLQRTLQGKMLELEKLCTQERQLIEGKWRTHSLPARKKYSQQNSSGDPESPTQTPYPYCRTTVSTEDVAKLPEKQRNSSLILAYRYLDPHYGYILQPTNNSSEYLLAFDDGKSINEHHLLVKTPSETPVTKQNKGNQTKFCMEKEKKNTCHVYSGNLCNSCVQVPNNSDNVSLDAYDLASPCCNPHCVPSNRRRSKHHKDSMKRRDSKSEETQCDLPPQNQRPPRSRPHSQTSQVSPSSQTFYVPRKNFHIGPGLVSQCSLHSFTSSEQSAIAPTTTGESSGSYTTSLSTDTLYWNGSCDIKPSKNSSGKFKYECQNYPHANETVYVQYNVVKPKSWDSLETKAFGGYGFGGYGYIDSVSKNKAGSTRSNSSKKSQGTQCARMEKTNFCSAQTPQYTPHTQRRYFNTNRSTESLLSYQKYADSNNSCDSLNPLSPGTETRFFQSPKRNSSTSEDPNTYYSVKNSTLKQVSTSSEATRL
ncbi:uncharacterized protein LOC123674215 isoform X1 [Harmonia axyridis]|uniref:uncharacterized protein LOC123674215 isoform X1 n=1 Tax=Harmonia axyridis TaxID=115357 RepID=UPI001E2771A5|nr:uncharacterized protein LOC123674215 isoform X1 [Harmonia axyridis]